VGHKFDPENIELLVSAERHNEMDPHEFLRSNGLSAGMCLADIGCGPGFFTFPAAEIIGIEGKVYAVDMQSEMLKEIKRRNPPENVVVTLSDENRIPIKSHTCDMALLSFVFHEATDKVAFLDELKRIIKPGGKLLLLEWEKKIEEKGPPFEDRIGNAEAERFVKKVGFTIEQNDNITLSHYRILATFS